MPRITLVMHAQAELVPIDNIAHSIVFLRGHKVILDEDLAALYGVTTKRLNEQVRRNQARFPADFMFQLTAEEYALLRSQIATSNRSDTARRPPLPPDAFTEHGAIIATTVLDAHDEAIASILSAIRELTNPPAVKRRPIGFTANFTECT
jgi:hypothetical protein